MKRGFLYLTAIIDVYSRFNVGWQLSNSLDKETQTAVLQEAVRRYDKPEIVKSTPNPLVKRVTNKGRTSADQLYNDVLDDLISMVKQKKSGSPKETSCF
jgi:transposase InsO family protein